MSQPIKSSFNENFNNQVPNVPYFSQQINNNVAELLEKENINKKDDNFIYELVFNIVSNISNSDKPSDIKIKIIRILTKLIENILKAETLGKDSEKYRRVKITNPNISLLFDIKGNYEFIKLLGFEEEFYNEELCLYLPKENLKIPLFQEVLSYIELLLLNFEENFENNYYESSENNKIEEDEKESSNNLNNKEEDIDIENNIFEDNNINNLDHNDNINNNIDNYNGLDIKEILKNTKDVRLGNNNNNLEYGDNWNIRPAGPSREGARILRQTGQERYRKALQFNNNNSGNNNKINDNNFHPNIHTFDDFNNYGNSSSFKSNDKFSTVKDDIGKKCLELTNQFRAKNKLPPLKWDDSIWKISLTHSKNMGDGKVPFGHKGFNERIKQFPFHFSLACENVFMCQGYSEYSIAENAVNGWINSPGHRKNLLSNTNFCAIATYRTSSGAYYLTQMFARK
jgi:uncharacterized protein YkwD